MPTVFQDLGSDEAVPRPNPGFDPAGGELSVEDYFVLTRVDGQTSVKQLILICGLPTDKVVGILRKLRKEGAILMPGDEPPRKKPAAPAPSAPMLDVPFDERALAEEVDLSMDQKRAILTKHASLKSGSYFDLLEVSPDADRKTIKRAYFKLSKEFHPDRFYGKKLGSYQARLAEIFEVASKGFELLSDDARRQDYVARITGQGGEARASRGQTRAQHAAELFEKACQLHISGELEEALKLFAAAIRLDGRPRYLLRATDCALAAGELSKAEEYAKKAAEIDARDAFAHRMLAKVLRASGRLDEARSELATASRLDPENEHIAAELEELEREG